MFDADTSSFSATPPGLACAVRYDTCYAEKKGRPCFHYGTSPSAPKDAATPSFYVTRTVEDGDTAVAVGSPAAGSGPAARAAPQVIGFMKGARKAAWRTRLLPEGDEVHYGVTQSELRDGRLTAFYQTKKGPFRLVSRDALTGALLWSATVPRSDEGSYAAAFGVEDGRVLVVMNQTVHIFDAATGEYLKGLDASTI
jgi:outer membrane protein assembly factor BamB